jgi:predicted metalloenzyme YecM
MSSSASDILKSAPQFIQSVIDEAKSIGVDLDAFQMDHFCFRVENEDQYDHYKKEFAQFGILLSEAQVNGRPIATYKLHEPVTVGEKRIPCIEIPSPKTGSAYPLGLEHVECVVAEPLSRFIQRFPLMKFDIRAMKKALNPEVALKLPSGKSVKFHNLPLENVIELEKKMGL